MDEIASGVDMATMCRDLTNSVIQSFYHVVLGKKLSEVADESIRELTAFKARAKALLKHGEALRVDVSAAEATLAKSKARKSKVVTDMQTAMAQLNFLLAFPQGACLKLDDKILYEPSPYKCPDIYMTAVSNRSEVAKANISIDQAKAQVKIAQSALAPDINLQLQGQRLNDDWNVLDPEGTNDYSVQGTLVWAFDIFRSRETVRKTRNAYAQTYVNKEYLVQQIMREVNTAYLQVKQNEANVEEFRTEIKWRKDQLDRIKAMYNQQLTTYLNVMDAIASLDLSKSSYFTAVINHAIAVAELERQMGTLR
jgi:outer membrane protein TolC